MTEPDYVRAARVHLDAMERQHKRHPGDGTLWAVRHARIHLQSALALREANERIQKGMHPYERT